MASSPIRTVVVTGATGGQGGAIIDVLLTTPPFPVHIKGTTRNLSSPAAQSLTSRGVEMVHADYDDPSTLRAAFQNAWAIYAVTDFWQLFASNTSAPEAAMEQEYTHGTNLARAAAEVETLKHYIWSTVPSAQDISNGSCSVLHFDSKSLVDKFIRRELKESLYPKTTMLWVPFYAKNLQWLPMWKPSFDEVAGKYTVRVPVDPETKFASLGSLRNVGLAVAAIIARDGEHQTTPRAGSKNEAKYVFVNDGFYSLQSYYDTWAKVALSGAKQAIATASSTVPESDTKGDSEQTSKTKVLVQHLKREDYVSLYGGFGREMCAMFDFWRSMGEYDSWMVSVSCDADTLPIQITLQDLLEGTDYSVVGLEESFRELSWEGIQGL